MPAVSPFGAVGEVDRLIQRHQCAGLGSENEAHLSDVADALRQLGRAPGDAPSPVFV
jgi:hypothetical protein